MQLSRLHAEAVALQAGLGGDPLSLVNASYSVWILLESFHGCAWELQRPWSNRLCFSMDLIMVAKISIIDYLTGWLRAVFANCEAERQPHGS